MAAAWRVAASQNGAGANIPPRAGGGDMSIQSHLPTQSYERFLARDHADWGNKADPLFGYGPSKPSAKIRSPKNEANPCWEASSKVLKEPPT